MPEIPNTRETIRNFATTLVNALREGRGDTKNQREWSDRNFEVLKEFARKHDADSFPDKTNRNKQFLWDFIGYIEQRGLLIAAESEWKKQPDEIQHDFEKLLYVKSPIKLMMCRINKESEAEEIRSRLQHFMETTCTEYSSGEVYVIYCVWWAGKEKENRDVAYWLQIEGDPTHVPISNVKFSHVPSESPMTT
jgi:hypothetical protein